MPAPFVAYLRVYEPLSSFDTAKRATLARAVDRGPVSGYEAGLREQQMWLRAQAASPQRLLPGESADGKANGAPPDVLTLSPEEVPSGPDASVGPGPLICPLDLRGRSAAALVGFLGSAEVPLRSAALWLPEDTAKARANAVVSELADDAVHVLSSTWTVPLPWFSLVEPERRQVLETADGQRRVVWRSAMADARRRASRAYSIAREALGDDGPTRVVRETGRWLERFHPHSAVELDYGGLVQMMSEADLEADTSAEDVHAIVDALEAGDAEEVGERYEALRDFWGEYASHERFN